MDERELSREIRTALPAAVLAAGPPPRPLLPDPWGLRELRPGTADSELLVEWMARPHVREFWQQDWPSERWNRVLQAQLEGDFSRPYLVLRDGRPFAYLEVYRTCRDLVSAVYPAEPHDLGVHFAIGEVADTGCGLGRELLRVLAPALLLADPACRRVLVEPDARNLPARKMFSGAGFQFIGERDLGHKTAALLVHDRQPPP